VVWYGIAEFNVPLDIVYSAPIDETRWRRTLTTKTHYSIKYKTCCSKD